MLKYYDASFVMRSKDPSTLRIVDIWTFKSIKSHKRYIVEIEHFSRKFLGLKFYWKGVADSKDRYSLLTNDYEPRTIIMSCIHIMLDYYKKMISHLSGLSPRLTWIREKEASQTSVFVSTAT